MIFDGQHNRPMELEQPPVHDFAVVLHLVLWRSSDVLPRGWEHMTPTAGEHSVIIMERDSIAKKPLKRFGGPPRPNLLPE
jgi:hypothetical protein